MSIFSGFKKKGVYRLLNSDFKTESEDFEVLSVRLSPDFFEKFPQAKKKEEYTGKNTLITNSTQITLFGKQVEISYDPSTVGLNETKFVDHINRKLNWISAHEATLKNGIAQELVPMKNERWLNEGETEISPDEFVKRIHLDGITFFADQNAELTFGHEDLFAEHQVVAGLSKKNDLIDIGIRG